MGRTEGSLDPDAGPVQRFAHELRLLRRSANGITYRAMARQAGYSAVVLSQAAAGARLPTLPVTLAYVTACGGDPDEWERRWRKASADVAALATSPYLGLATFEETDRDRFFGRDRLIAEILALTARHRFVAVVGASGAGKSSLLRAGVLPRLRERDPATAVALCTPGTLTDPGEGTVLVVDQFEELFTLCDARERALVIAALMGSRARVIVALRADFYGRCAEHPALADALCTAQVLVGPMTADELRVAIVAPATAAGLVVQRALTTRLVDEVLDEPGGLPMVSHVLLETWRRRRGRTLTVAGYEAAGGVHGALARTAEQVYAALSPGQAATARRVLLRLVVVPTEDAQATRRPARRAEFSGSDNTGTVVERLAEARLVTLDGDAVDLAHEALITAWPRLAGWIRQDHQWLRVHRNLGEATRAWEEVHRDPGALYRGTRLAMVREWVTGHRGEELNAAERAFVAASVDAERTASSAEARRRRRLRWLAAGLATALLVVTALAGVTLAQHTEAVATRQTAISRQLAAEALALRDTAPGTAMLLGVAAYRTASTPEARGALLSLASYQVYQGELYGHGNAVSDVAFRQDGARLASVGKDGRLVVWDTRRRARLATLTAHRTWLRAVAYSPDGHTLATGGDDADLVLWDAGTGERVAALSGHTDRIRDVRFSPDGRLVATAGNDRTAVLWDRAAGVAAHRLTGHRGVVQAVVFSPDGQRVATAGADRTIRLWDTATGRALATLTGHAAAVDGLAFSPDGRLLASASSDHTVGLWDPVTGARLATLSGHTDAARAVAFSPDGRTLASAGHDDTVILWDLPSRAVRARLTGHTNNVYALAFHPRLPLLASGEEQGRVLLWDVDRAPLPGHAGTVTATAFSRDGRTVATAGTDGTVVLWDVAGRHPVATVRSTTGPVNALTFSHDGRTLAVATGSPRRTTGVADGGVHLLDVTDRAAPVVRATLTGHTDAVRDAAFTPDDRTLATASSDGTVAVWDARRHTRLDVLPGDESLNSVEFSPDGRVLATSNGNAHQVVLWDFRARARLATLTHTGLPRELAFSPDGRTLATVAAGRAVVLWDVERGTPVRRFTHHDTLNSLAFSADGRLLVTGGAENTVGLWDAVTGARLATLTGHTGPVEAVAIAPDGRTVASADSTTILWTTDENRAIREICRVVGRDLTRAERSQFLPDEHPRTCPAFA